MAVGGRGHARLRADIGGGARPVLDDELLPEPLGEPLTHKARDKVGPAARRVAHYNAHRTRRIGLRACNPRRGRERRNTHCQFQKPTPENFHCSPPFRRRYSTRAILGMRPPCPLSAIAAAVAAVFFCPLMTHCGPGPEVLQLRELEI